MLLGKAGVKGVRIIICGGLLQLPAVPERAALDIDAEVDCDIEVIKRLKNAVISCRTFCGYFKMNDRYS